MQCCFINAGKVEYVCVLRNMARKLLKNSSARKVAFQDLCEIFSFHHVGGACCILLSFTVKPIYTVLVGSVYML